MPSKQMMTIHFDTITNNYEVIYVSKSMMKYHLKKIDTSFQQPLPSKIFIEERFLNNVTGTDRICPGN
jgi:hypothetical protein